jgi:molecular chaperone DnaK (HSP70)
MKSNLNSYFPGFNRFIGIKSNSNLYNEEKKYILNEMKITNCSSEYLYKYNLLNNDIVFIVDDESVFPESLMASFINKIKHYLLERKKHVISVSIAYPDYYTLSELEGYTRSLRIADVDSYHIISEQTASNIVLT